MHVHYLHRVYFPAHFSICLLRKPGADAAVCHMAANVNAANKGYICDTNTLLRIYFISLAIKGAKGGYSTCAMPQIFQQRGTWTSTLWKMGKRMPAQD